MDDYPFLRMYVNSRHSDVGEVKFASSWVMDAIDDVCV